VLEGIKAAAESRAEVKEADNFMVSEEYNIPAACAGQGTNTPLCVCVCVISQLKRLHLSRLQANVYGNVLSHRCDSDERLLGRGFSRHQAEREHIHTGPLRCFRA
jgi:hypothetical protein